MPDAKRPDPKRRSPASRPGRGRPRRSAASRRPADQPPEPVAEPIRRSIVESAELRSEQRLGLTARRAAILAAVVCVLTLTIAGPVRTYFAQRTEMKQLAAVEASTQQQRDDLQRKKDQLADPAYIIAMARERLGYVMPGETPYQVQVPATAAGPGDAGAATAPAASQGPWYTALWHTIADDPHGPPPPPGPPSPAQPGG